MKVAFITGAMPPAKCGVGDYTDVLISNLVNEGVDIHVITNVEYGEINKLYTLHNVVKKWYCFNFFKTVISTLKKTGCELVHIQYPTISYKAFIEINLLPILLRFFGYKVVYTIHEYSQRPFLSRVRRWPSIFGSNKVIVVEELFKKDIIKIPFFKFSKRKIEVINIGSNIPKSSLSLKEIQNLKNSLFNDYKGLVASYFGFINENKEFLITIETMGNLKKTNKLFFKLLIISQLDIEDSYQKEVIDLIKKFDLEDNIKITGFIPKENVGNYIACSDFAISLFSKGLSVRNGSFLALYQEGIKVITSLPINEYPINLENVIYIKKNTVFNLENALFEILKTSLNKDFQQITDWKGISKRHISIYEGLIKN